MREYDLVIVGAGSGNMLLDDSFSGWRIAIVESDRFGGTCLNRGCIPSKMFVYAGDVAQSVRHAERYGVHAEWRGADWSAIRDRIFSRIDPLHARAVEFRRRNGVDVYLGETWFVDRKVMAVGEELLHGEHIVLAVGSRPKVPDIPGLGKVEYHTSDTIMRLDSLPASMVVIGGGFIAAEMSHVFGALGSEVTIVHRGPDLLASHDRDIRERFTQCYGARFDLRLDTTVEEVSQTSVGVALNLISAGRPSRIEAEILLVATGRVPNSDRIQSATGGLALDEHGHIRTDDTYATNVQSVFAFGDLANHFQLKHMANAETRIVRHNLLHPDAPRRAGFTVVPAAVFADPQVASVGMTEQELEHEGRPYAAGRCDYSSTAYGWALEDTTSFVKVLADPDSRQLLGAHVIGPQASILIQPLIQAMCLGNTVDEVSSGVLYIHPALSEAVEQALLEI